MPGDAVLRTLASLHQRTVQMVDYSKWWIADVRAEERCSSCGTPWPCATSIAIQVAIDAELAAADPPTEGDSDAG